MAQETSQFERATDELVNTVTQGITAEFVDNPIEKLRFPLRNQDEYAGRVTFTVIEVESITPSVFKSLENFNVDNLLNRFTSLFTSSEDIPTTEEALEAKAATEGEDGETISFENKSQAKTRGSSVTLYLPPAFPIRDAVNYTNVDLGTIGGAIEAVGAAGGSIGQGFSAGLSKGVESFIDAFKGSAGDAASVAVTNLASKFGDGVGGAVQGLTRTTINPNTRSLFKNVELRQFPFTFKMVASSPQEAEEIKKIIKFFRSELYPGSINTDLPGEAGVSIPIGYKVPNLFEIKMTYDNKPVFTGILDSYLIDVNVVYNQNGPAFVRYGEDVAPLEVEIGLNFRESKTLTRERVEEGF